jgi:hypothetical protein
VPYLSTFLSWSLIYRYIYKSIYKIYLEEPEDLLDFSDEDMDIDSSSNTTRDLHQFTHDGKEEYNGVGVLLNTGFSEYEGRSQAHQPPRVSSSKMPTGQPAGKPLPSASSESMPPPGMKTGCAATAEPFPPHGGWDEQERRFSMSSSKSGLTLRKLPPLYFLEELLKPHLFLFATETKSNNIDSFIKEVDSRIELCQMGRVWASQIAQEDGRSVKKRMDYSMNVT